MTKDDADDVTGFSSSLASYSRYGPGMQSNCNPLRCKPPERILHTSLQRVPRRRRVSTLTGYLSTASFFTDLHHRGVCLQGARFGPAHIGTATKLIRENAACSARPTPLKRRRSPCSTHRLVTTLPRRLQRSHLTGRRTLGKMSSHGHHYMKNFDETQPHIFTIRPLVGFVPAVLTSPLSRSLNLPNTLLSQ
jgi:hypothetical protein